jgi:hypothetical protein
VERGAKHIYRLLGKRLSGANRNLFRNGKTGKGLIQVLGDVTHRLITKAGQLAPVVVDTRSIHVIKDAKSKVSIAVSSHGTTRATEEFGPDIRRESSFPRPLLALSGAPDNGCLNSLARRWLWLAA